VAAGIVAVTELEMSVAAAQVAVIAPHAKQRHHELAHEDRATHRRADRIDVPHDQTVLPLAHVGAFWRFAEKPQILDEIRLTSRRGPTS
jgi:hypothetical protein